MTTHRHQPVIHVAGLGKRYRLGGQARLDQTLPEVISDSMRRIFARKPRRTAPRKANTDFWALRDVSFSIERGEVIGVIGRNGAGKSTLLKILAQITDPTEGRAQLRGRVASLLEVGTGFHPELTGRENIYLNGAIMSMTRREIKAKFDDIVAFSGVEAFLDTPVKRYSSGMAVRLAFSVAAHLDPEILIIDEVLAVGDAAFQKKCLGKMQDIATSEGRTVLFVSHNMDSIMHLSTKVMVMDGGRTGGIEPVESGVKRYFAAMAEHDSTPLLDRPRKFSAGRPPVFDNLRILGPDDQANVIPCGGAMRVLIDLANMQSIQQGECGIVITNEQGQRVAILQSRYHANMTLEGTSITRIECEVPSLSLVPGTYQVDLSMVDNARMIEYVDCAGRFEVVFADVLGTGRLPNSKQGHLVIPATWKKAA